MLPVGGIEDTLYSVMKVSHMLLLSGEHGLLTFSQTPPKTVSRLIASTMQRVIWPTNKGLIMLIGMPVAVQCK